MTLGLELENTRRPRPSRAPRSIVVLGATGSIGTSTADIIRNSGGAFEVAAVAGGRDALALAKVARELGARFAALADSSATAP